MTDSLRGLEGTCVGRHRLDRLFRQGGMGGVFLGEHVQTGAQVAIKVQHADALGHPELGARFDREAEVMGRLASCPGVVTVHDVGQLPDGRRYLVMDFVRGVDLGDVLVETAAADERMDLDRACSIMAQVAASLSAAHARAVVHRDLKPANIMLQPTRSGERALLLDFGVSADLGERGQAQALTAAGEVLGTPQYMAPEQAAGVTSSPAVDVYAMGAILHQMLTGLAPPETGWRGARVPVASVRKTPAALAQLLGTMLDVDASARPGSARAVELALHAVLDELRRPVVAVHERSVQPDAVAGVMTVESGPLAQAQLAGVRPKGAQQRWAWGLGVAALLAVLGLGGWWWGRPSPPPATPAAPPSFLLGQDVRAAQRTPTKAGPDAQPAPEPELQPQPEPEPEPDPRPEAKADLPPPKDPSPNPTPTPDKPVEDRCASAREAAASAHTQGRWSAVLKHSKRRGCWSGADADDRQAMRVKAHLELKQYSACIREGSGASDPKVAKMTAFCERKASP